MQRKGCTKENQPFSFCFPHNFFPIFMCSQGNVREKLLAGEDSKKKTQPLELITRKDVKGLKWNLQPEFRASNG
jgi:hypothetical protein